MIYLIYKTNTNFIKLQIFNNKKSIIYSIYKITQKISAGCLFHELTSSTFENYLQLAMASRNSCLVTFLNPAGTTNLAHGAGTGIGLKWIGSSLRQFEAETESDFLIPGTVKVPVQSVRWMIFEAEAAAKSMKRTNPNFILNILMCPHVLCVDTPLV